MSILKFIDQSVCPHCGCGVREEWVGDEIPDSDGKRKEKRKFKCGLYLFHTFDYGRSRVEEMDECKYDDRVIARKKENNSTIKMLLAHLNEMVIDKGIKDDIGWNLKSQLEHINENVRDQK